MLIVIRADTNFFLVLNKINLSIWHGTTYASKILFKFLNSFLKIRVHWSGAERSKVCNAATAVTTKLQRSNAARSVNMLHWAYIKTKNEGLLRFATLKCERAFTRRRKKKFTESNQIMTPGPFCWRQIIENNFCVFYEVVVVTVNIIAYDARS